MNDDERGKSTVIFVLILATRRWLDWMVRPALLGAIKLSTTPGSQSDQGIEETA